MAVYSVHLPGAGGAGVGDAAFVREGFCRAAFFFGPFWLLSQGLWLAAALWLSAFLAVLIIGGVGLIGAGAALALILLGQILLGLEADRLIEHRLWRRGFDLAEIVAAPHREEAELAFYRQYDASGAGASALAAVRAPPRPPAAPTIIGSFPTPGV